MSRVTKFVSSREFAAAAKAGDAQGLGVRRDFTMKVAAGPTDLTARITISTAAPDRANDTIDVAGWETSSYVKNPVVLWAHRDRELPIAKTLQLNVGKSSLEAVAEFTPEHLNPFGFQVFGLLRSGFLAAASVGFAPVEWKFREEPGNFGIDYLKQELLEFSIVPVPCNQECLVDPGSLAAEDASEDGKALAQMVAQRAGLRVIDDEAWKTFQQWQLKAAADHQREERDRRRALLHQLRGK